MIVLNILSLDQIEADKKDAVWYKVETAPDRVSKVVIDNHVVGYNLTFVTPLVSEVDFLIAFPQAKKVQNIQAESAIN